MRSGRKSTESPACRGRLGRWFSSAMNVMVPLSAIRLNPRKAHDSLPPVKWE